MELKFTLQYSNPHIIRQVAIPEKFTLQQLYRVICICVNRETLGTDVRFLKNGVELEKTQQITQEMFSSEAQVICSCNDKTNKWEWRIEAVFESNQLSKEQDGKVPKLVHFQGIHIGSKAKNVVEFNSYANHWYDQEDQIVLDNLINVRLGLLFADKQLDNQDSTIKFTRLKSCLLQVSMLKVDEMKEIEKKFAMKHPANVPKNKRTQLIVNDYVSDPLTIKMALESLTMAEFDAFLELYACAGTLEIKKNGNHRGNYRTLSRYGLVSVKPVEYGRGIRVDMSIELAMGARHFMDEEKKSELQRMVIARAVIEACINLYGFASYWHYNKLIEACYNKFFSPEQKQQCWDTIVAMEERGQETYIYSKALKVFCKTLADQMWILKQFEQGFEALPYYIPTIDVIKQTQEYGLAYPTSEYEDLCEVVKQNCTQYYDSRELAARMLQDCIEGEKPRWVAEDYKQFCLKRTVGVKNLGEALIKIDANIRRPEYYGHTKNEYSKLLGGKVK